MLAKSHHHHPNHDHKLDDDEMKTMVIKAKSYINQRPLAAGSDDPSDLHAITPNDFLKTGARFKQLLPEVEDFDPAGHLRSIHATEQKLWQAY